MPMQTNYFKIGLFVVIAFILLVAGVVFFGLSSAFKTQILCETYFDQSVQGLSEGSAVKFRGFKIGQVDTISLSTYSDRLGRQLVQVRFSLDPVILVGKTGDPEEAGWRFIQNEIKSGLRVFLSMQGVTGVGFLDLDYYAPGPGDDKSLATAPDESAQVEALYVPNAPGRVMEIGESVSQIVKSLGNVDFAGISHDLKSILERADQLVAHFQNNDVAGATVNSLHSIKAAADDIASFAKHLDETVEGAQFKGFREDMAKTMEQFRMTLKRTEQLLRSPQSNLPATLENIRVMTENLRELTELLKQYPGQIIFGGAPKEVKP